MDGTQPDDRGVGLASPTPTETEDATAVVCVSLGKIFGDVPNLSHERPSDHGGIGKAAKASKASGRVCFFFITSASDTLSVAGH